MRTRLRLFLQWGITFDEPYVLQDKGAREVAYASKEELLQRIVNEYHLPEDLLIQAPKPKSNPMKAVASQDMTENNYSKKRAYKTKMRQDNK